jgi:hypothetical protein
MASSINWSLSAADWSAQSGRGVQGKTAGRSIGRSAHINITLEQFEYLSR